MKYIFLNDLVYILKNKYRIINAYTAIFLCYFLCILNSNFGEFNILNNIFCYDIYIIKNIGDIFSISLILLNYGLYLYLALSVFIKDFDNLDNLILRISFSKWIGIKVLTQLFITLIINIIIFLFVLLFMKVDLIFLLIIIKKVLFVKLIEIYMYFILIMNKRSNILTIFLIFLFSIFILFVHIEINKINLFLILLLTIIFNLILKKVAYHTKFSDLKG